MGLTMHRVPDMWRDTIETRLKENWRPYLLCFVFNRLRGGRTARRNLMARLLEQAYSIYLLSGVPVPHVKAQNRDPIWLCAPAFRLQNGHRVRNPAAGDDLRYYAILLLPPWLRIDDVRVHFESDMSLYRKVASLNRIEIRQISNRFEFEKSHHMKTGADGRFDLPRRAVPCAT